MNRLPFELTDKVFDLLPTSDICTLCSLNHDWNTIATIKLYRYPLLKTGKALALFVQQTTEKSQNYIQVLDLTPVHQHVTDTCLSSLSVKYLKHLNLSKCIDLSPTTILSVIHHNVDHLITLSLANCTLTSAILHNIGRANQQGLKRLDLSNTMIKPCISIDSPNHLETMLLEPFSDCQLTHLDLSYCTWVNSRTVENISFGLVKLEHLGLQWCNQVKLKSMHALAKRLKKLKSLDARHMDSIASMQDAFGIMSYSRSLKKISFTSSCKRTTAQIEL